MGITIWVLNKYPGTYKELCKTEDIRVAVQTINFLTKTDEYLESKFRFSFKGQVRRYKLITILKMLGYERATPFLSSSVSYYLKEGGSRVNILNEALRNIN
ncbi:MAG: hypothetical protein WAX66_03665 [Patescibacteria group bacterium]